MEGDFRNFLFDVWKFLNLPAPTERQYEIAWFLQHGPNRKMIEAFRGIGKSWETSAYVLWNLRFIDPDLKFLIGSASKERADAFSTFTKRLITDMPILQVLKPKPEQGQRDSMVAFDVGPSRPAHAPSVKSVGIFGQMTGSRANEVIFDDVEVPNNSETQDKRDKLEARCKESEAIIVPGGKITYLGTPQTEESIYNKLPERGYTVQVWPAEYPSEKDMAIWKGNLAPSIEEAVLKNPKLVGRSTDPVRFSDEDLAERKASYGRSGYRLQFMLDTSLSDAEKYPLKLSDLIVMSCNSLKAPVAVAYGSSPDLQVKELANIGFTGDRWYRPMFIDEKWSDYEGRVMAIDPSGRGTDHLTWCIVNHLHGTLYLTDIGGFQDGYGDATLHGLARKAQLHKPNVVVIEDNFGDGMFSKILSPVLRQYHRCAIEEVKQHVQKERRIIDALEPVMNQHRLVVDKDLVERDIKKAQESTLHSLFYQMTRITKERGALKHDDYIDVLALAIKYWTEVMGKERDECVQDYRQRLLDEDLAKFLENAVTVGQTRSFERRSNADSWMNHRYRS